MCGRYASARSVDDIAAAFGIAEPDVDVDPAPDWNVAPTKQVPAVMVRDERRHLVSLRWGLVPPWADDPSVGARMCNARIESVADKPAFREALRRRRCLLPADGWYEWQRRGDGERVPHYLSPVDGGVIAFAGLWEVWYDADRRPLVTTTIITAPAPPDLAAIHDRAPVVLPPAVWSTWLDPHSGVHAVGAALRPTPAGVVTSWPVAPDVGDVHNNGQQLTTRVEVPEQPSLF